MNSPNATLSYVTAAMMLNLPAGTVRGDVLDVGCGNKPYKRVFGSECTKWIGLDTKPVGEVQADMAGKFPFEDGSFDTVILTDSLHLSCSPLTTIMECARVLAVGGHLVISAPMLSHDPECHFTIHPKGLDFLVSQTGLKGLSLVTEGKTFTSLWAERFSVQPDEVSGWMSHMDKRYRMIVFAVAVKEQ
jgi:SAM-dependent methyltransferase